MSTQSVSVNNEYLRDPDVQLMLRVKEGDEQAFGRLVTKYQDRLVSIFMHLLDDAESAEDLAQDVFLRVYRAKKGYEPNAKFSTWIFRIANNVASNMRRSKGRRKEVQFGEGDTGMLQGRPGERHVPEKSGLMPTRQLDKSEMQSMVQEALQTLSERHRMALLLHKFEGMSYVDVGEALEISEAAVKSLLARARDHLRTKLEPYIRTES